MRTPIKIISSIINSDINPQLYFIMPEKDCIPRYHVRKSGAEKIITNYSSDYIQYSCVKRGKATEKEENCRICIQS